MLSLLLLKIYTLAVQFPEAHFLLLLLKIYILVVQFPKVHFLLLLLLLCRPTFWGSVSCTFMQLVLPSVATPGGHMASFNWLLWNQILLFEELSGGDTWRRIFLGLQVWVGRTEREKNQRVRVFQREQRERESYGEKVRKTDRDWVWGRSKLESFGEDIRGWTKRAESFRERERFFWRDSLSLSCFCWRSEVFWVRVRTREEGDFSGHLGGCFLEE